MTSNDAIFLVKFIAVGQPETSIVYPAFSTDFRNCIIRLCDDVEQRLADKPIPSQAMPEPVVSQNSFLRRTLNGYYPEYYYGDTSLTADSLIAHKIYAEDDEMAAALVEGFASNRQIICRQLNTEEHAYFGKLRHQGISEPRELPLSREAVQLMRKIRNARSAAAASQKAAANG